MRKFVSAVLGCVAFVAFGMAGTASAQAGDPHSMAAGEPVVFVHGYTGNNTNWAAAQDIFVERGYGEDQLHPFQYNWSQSNERSAEELSAFVDEVLAQTGAQKVDIVNHSMGGLVSGWYAKKLGGLEKIDDWASLAGANHGTTSAAACTVFASCREMLYNSSWIQELHSGGEAPAPVKWSTWVSPLDGVILPYQSTALEGAENHTVPAVNHLAILSDSGVINEVIDTVSS